MYKAMIGILGNKTGGESRVAPMKSFFRVMEKLFIVPGALERWEHETVGPEHVDEAVRSHAPADIVRGWIAFDDVSQMKLALGLFPHTYILHNTLAHS